MRALITAVMIAATAATVSAAKPTDQARKDLTNWMYRRVTAACEQRVNEMTLHASGAIFSAFWNGTEYEYLGKPEQNFLFKEGVIEANGKMIDEAHGFPDPVTGKPRC